MGEDSYNVGYIHGVTQARPIVALEYRVKRLEYGQTLLGFLGGFIGGYIGGKFLVSLAFYIRDRMKGSGSIDYGKAKKEGDVKQRSNEDGNTRGTYGKNVRRHARDFNIRM